MRRTAFISDCGKQQPIGVSAKDVQRLKRIQNILAHVVCNVPYGRSTTDSLQTLHWLPNLRVTPISSIAELIHECVPAWSLRYSDKHLLHQPTTNRPTVAESRAFAVAAARNMNSLPVTVTACINYCNYCTFKTKLKTHPFPLSWPNNSASDD